MNTLRRRTFIARASGAGLLTLLAGQLPRAARSDPLGIPIGIQLWTVNEAMQSDPAGTLGQLRKIGYKNVETAGFGKLSATELRRLLDEAGLACPSAHLNFMEKSADAVLADAHTLGAHYVVSSILHPGSGAVPTVRPAMQSVANYFRAMTLGDAHQTAQLANRIGLKAKQTGLQYVYHNHFFEFVAQENGAIAYDILLKECDPDLVQFEIDCGWMIAAGYDPVHYLRKYPRRFPMMHVKDFLRVSDDAPAAVSPALRVGTELGRGFIDYGPIFSAAKPNGLKYYFVEQEGPFDTMNQFEAAEVNYQYLHSFHE
jgi:sugar phosphate isomerase/epimerase